MSSPSALGLRARRRWGRTRESFIAELRAAGATVVRDTFTASTPLGPIPMTNIVAKILGDSSAVVIIAGHYDTKRSTFPFVGANNGGSSPAFLLEIARVLARRKNALSYWLSSMLANGLRIS